VVRLQQDPILPPDLVEAARADGDGAVALFLGTVRDASDGRRVVRLEYEAYPEMAEREMARIEAEAIARFGISRIVIVHRTGRLEIGEVSVGVAAASPHRAQAMDACRYAIDALKERVPIWKKEHFEEGAVWIEGERRSQARSSSSSPSSSNPR
jgi:molybdopterin synthase catalytic subunit